LKQAKEAALKEVKEKFYAWVPSASDRVGQMVAMLQMQIIMRNWSQDLTILPGWMKAHQLGLHGLHLLAWLSDLERDAGEAVALLRTEIFQRNRDLPQYMTRPFLTPMDILRAIESLLPLAMSMY
jgi:hypothetical protein